MNTTNTTNYSLRAGTAFAFAAALLMVPAAKAGIHVLQFTAGDSNAPISSNYITLNSPALNGKPGLKPIITQYWTGVYNNHPVAVWYITGTNAASGRWSIYNEDSASIPVGAAFNVLVPASATTLNATPLNSVDGSTAFSTQKGNAAALLFFTHMWNPYLTLGSGVYVPSSQSLAYPAASDPHNPLNKEWYIFNQDESPAIATSYFIFDAASVPGSLHAVKFSHLVTSGNNDGYDGTYLNETNALTSVSNVVFITPVNNNDNIPVGVYYTGQWDIFNQDTSVMNNGKKFNVLMFPSVIP